jgi:hypothetical protein
MPILRAPPGQKQPSAALLGDPVSIGMRALLEEQSVRDEERTSLQVVGYRRARSSRQLLAVVSHAIVPLHGAVQSTTCDWRALVALRLPLP